MLALREGQALPEGWRYVVRGQSESSRPRAGTETVDLTTQPDAGAEAAGEEADDPKRKSSDKRNETRNSNKRAHASYVKEVKESLAEGRPPAIKVSEDATHLKARWHAAAKEVAYKLLDLRKEGWKSYSTFDKTRLHKEMRAQYKFDPPIEKRDVEKFLAGHLRSARAVWKAHWVKHGDGDKHPNCPPEAWEALIKRWPTEACKEESADMANRRSCVQNNSKTGRKRLLDRQDEQVSYKLHDLYCLWHMHVRFDCVQWAMEGGWGWLFLCVRGQGHLHCGRHRSKPGMVGGRRFVVLTVSLWHRCTAGTEGGGEREGDKGVGRRRVFFIWHCRFRRGSGDGHADQPSPQWVGGEIGRHEEVYSGAGIQSVCAWV